MKQRKPLSALKKGLLLAMCLIVLIGAFLGIYFVTKPQAAIGEKNITVTIAPLGEKSTVYTLRTQREMLADVLLDEKLVAGEEGPYGLFITTAGGVTVTPDTQEWWCLTKGGETMTTGVSTTPIADGDCYELTQMDSY